MQNAANSSMVPRRRIGTCASTLARDFGVGDAVGPQELGEVHEVGADRVHLHAGAGDLGGDVAGEHRRRRRGPRSRAVRPGWAGRPTALVISSTWPSPRSTIARHDRPQEVVRSLEAARAPPRAGRRCVDFRNRPVTTRPDAAAAASRRPKRSSAASTSRVRRLGLGDVACAGDGLDRRARAPQLGDEAVVRDRRARGRGPARPGGGRSAVRRRSWRR